MNESDTTSTGRMTSPLCAHEIQSAPEAVEAPMIESDTPSTGLVTDLLGARVTVLQPKRSLSSETEPCSVPALSISGRVRALAVRGATFSMIIEVSEDLRDERLTTRLRPVRSLFVADLTMHEILVEAPSSQPARKEILVEEP